MADRPAVRQPGLPAAAALGRRRTGYDATASSGSNLGPTSQKLHDRVAADVERLKKENPDADRADPGRPGDRLGQRLGSAPVAGRQRCGKCRGSPRPGASTPSGSSKVIEAYIEPPTLGFLGEPRVNVLAVNLALNRKFGKPQ